MIHVVDGSLFWHSSASPDLATHWILLHLARTWNALPCHVKVCTTLTTFRGALREFLLEQYVVQGWVPSEEVDALLVIGLGWVYSSFPNPGVLGYCSVHTVMGNLGWSQISHLSWACQGPQNPGCSILYCASTTRVVESTVIRVVRYFWSLMQVTFFFCASGPHTFLKYNSLASGGSC